MLSEDFFQILKRNIEEITEEVQYDQSNQVLEYIQKELE